MLVNKINDIKAYVCSQFVEREEIVDAIFVSLVAKQHLLLIGPPGTAKSNLITSVEKFIEGTNYFQWLLTRFSTPEELFGPVSLKALENDVYKRNTTNKLPEANIAFIDEIFKANSAILNSLLTLINERIFYNNGGIVNSPLISMIGASNEYPEEESLAALFDRFLMRFEMEYVKQDNNFISMLKGNPVIKKPAALTLEELDQLQFNADLVTIPDEVFDTLLKIRTDLKDEGIQPSDRRFKQSLSLLRAKAVLDGRDVVEIDDILILKNGLWEEVEQKITVDKIVIKHAQDKVKTALLQIEKECKELWDYAVQEQSYDVGAEVTAKYKQHVTELTKLKSQNPKRTVEIDKLIDMVNTSRMKLAEAVMGI
ncbi:AAA family ATPase [Anaerobacillus isosaccharinicus]|uniref:ATPase n=1 Tax=Anaerobacillus isosaccharinicus TaxID=1532552 RepID=A0A1S2KY38_9BACI|nr:AAA family ATPase [Anaerobacillus isosaccharinicus]MBA5588915.1 AAA family ATPase [Anaerobacillus isosaccharinicus]QOY37674.1 AAA family ATPase [Anaerobacillus isosaccharinicus]